MIRNNIKIMLSSKAFLLGIVVETVCLIMILIIEQSNDIHYLYQAALDLGIANLVRPIAVTFPIAVFYTDLFRDENTYMWLVRANRKLLLSHVISAAIIGALCILFSLALFLFFCLLKNTGVTVLDDGLWNPTGTALEYYYARKYYLLVFATELFLFSISGAVWSGFSVVLSALTDSKYVVITTPFVLERVFSYFIQYLAADNWSIILLDPAYMYMFGRFSPLCGVPYACIYAGGVLFLCSIGLSSCMRRRKIHG